MCCVTCSAFDRLKEVRQLEYELDFAQNRAARDKAALKERLAAALAASQKLQVRARSRAWISRSPCSCSVALRLHTKAGGGSAALDSHAPLSSATTRSAC